MDISTSVQNLSVQNLQNIHIIRRVRRWQWAASKFLGLIVSIRPLYVRKPDKLHATQQREPPMTTKWRHLSGWKRLTCRRWLHRGRSSWCSQWPNPAIDTSRSLLFSALSYDQENTAHGWSIIDWNLIMYTHDYRQVSSISTSSIHSFINFYSTSSRPLLLRGSPNSSTVKKNSFKTKIECVGKRPR